MSLKDWAREGVYRLIYALTGPGQGVRAILLYHSVGSQAPHSVPLSIFQQQMELLMERFKVIRLCDLPKAIASYPSEVNLACVTFDDGYQDNYEHALPVLERFRVKATFFIATGFLGKTFRTFAGELPMMGETQLRELVALGHEIGAHTVSHPKLTKVSPEEAYREIANSKQFLEDVLQCGVLSFAYPKGDYNSITVNLVRRCGFQIAVTIREGLVSSQPNWLELPRIWVSNKLGLKSFEVRLSPATTIYSYLRSYRR